MKTRVRGAARAAAGDRVFLAEGLKARPDDARERHVRHKIAVEALKVEQSRIESVPGWEKNDELVNSIAAIRRSVRQLQVRFWKEVK